MSLESGFNPSEEGLINIDDLYAKINGIVQQLLEKETGGEIFSSIGDEPIKAFNRLMELSEKGIISPGILDNIEGTTKYGEYNISHASIIQALFTGDPNKGFVGFKEKLQKITGGDFSNLNLDEAREMIKKALEAFEKKLSERRPKEYPIY